jgi:hypothetical protein
MRPTARNLLAAACAAVLVLAAAQAAHADDADWGLRFGAYTDAEAAFVGAELMIHLDGRLYLNPNLEWAFAERRDIVSLNADLHYDAAVTRKAYVWVGGGLGVVFTNPEGQGNGDTDLGANFLGGAGLRGNVIPYFQLKVVVAGHSEVALTLGLRF